MEFYLSGFENHTMFHILHNVLDVSDDTKSSGTDANEPTCSYIHDARAMAATQADVKEYPDSYVFVVDMPGLKSSEINVQIENDNVLAISGVRKREEEKDEAKYVKRERRTGKFMRKFVLPENTDIDAIKAVCQDGVLSLTVEKLPLPEPKKPKTIEVNVA